MARKSHCASNAQIARKYQHAADTFEPSAHSTGQWQAMPLMSHDFSCVSPYTCWYDEELERISRGKKGDTDESINACS